MVNPYRGDVPLVLADKTHALRLTLGGLAELEQVMGVDTLPKLMDRFSDGSFSARDLCHVLAAGFAGAGQTVDPQQLAKEIPASAIEEAAFAAASLLAAAFGGGIPSRPPPPQATRA